MLRFLDIRHLFVNAISAACCLCGVTENAMAHPGHGSASSQTGFWHYLASPTHVVPILLLAILATAGLWLAHETFGEESDE